MKIVYENEWDRSVVHADIEFPYEEDYQMMMLRHNDFKFLVKITGTGREGKSRYTFYPGNALSLEKQYGKQEMKSEDLERFVFFENGKYRFCYLPVRESDREKTLCTMFHEITEYFIKRLDYRDTAGILLAYRLHKETLKENFDLRKILDEYKEEKETVNEQKKNQEIQGGIPDTAVFCSDEEEKKTENETIYPDILKEETCRFGILGKTVKKIKTGRWGRWDDLITEIDGQEAEGPL